MTSRRFPGVELTEWRSRLIDAHPRLFPDARPHQGVEGWALASAGWPGVPDGWRDLVGTLCRRLDVATAAETGGIVIHDIKEKFGLMRVSCWTDSLGAEAQADVDLAIDLAEYRSAHTCSICGERGWAVSDGGWITTRCDEHADGKPLPGRPERDVEVTTGFVDGRFVSTARRYVYEEDRFMPVPVLENRR